MLGIVCLAWLYIRKFKPCNRKYHPSQEHVKAAMTLPS
jgi:hypothetical protein